MATFAIGDEDRQDEIKNYQTGCYISSNEAIWRIHQGYLTAMNLAVHLENRVYFTKDTAHNIAKTPPETTLTDFFKLCQQDVFVKSSHLHRGSNLLYVD